MQVSIDDLITLAGKSSGDDELERYSGLPEGIREAIKEELAENQRNASKKVAKQLVEVFNIAEQRKKEYVQRIRSIRALERQLKNDLTAIDEAKELAESESNFIPLCGVLGILGGRELQKVASTSPELLEVSKIEVSKKKVDT